MNNNWKEYIEMAQSGKKWLEINKKAKADGIEGKELTELMSMVDHVIENYQENKSAPIVGITLMVIGVSLIVVGGILTSFGVSETRRIYSFNFILIGIGVFFMLSGIANLIKKR